jgi:hypothetical protein
LNPPLETRALVLKSPAGIEPVRPVQSAKVAANPLLETRGLLANNPAGIEVRLVQPRKVLLKLLQFFTYLKRSAGILVKLVQPLNVSVQVIELIKVIPLIGVVAITRAALA